MGPVPHTHQLRLRRKPKTCTVALRRSSVYWLKAFRPETFTCFLLFSLVFSCLFLFSLFLIFSLLSSFLLLSLFSLFLSFYFLFFSLFFLVCRYLPTQNPMFPRSSRRFVKYIYIFRKS